MNGFHVAVTLFGGLGLFLYGMKIMSESLQLATGEKLKQILWKVTNNPIKGVFTGISITALIQSSSATTVMVVSFVSAGLINLQQAVGIIMGANIGTTVTGWLVALLGFKVNIKLFALPAIGIGFFIRFLKKEKFEQWGEVLIGFGMLFLGLEIMSGSVGDLKNSLAIKEFMASFSASNIGMTFVVIFVGAAITMILQSSSATMALTMTLAVSGLIDFPTSCALILGENIGTTITANLASLGAPTEAKRAARVHFLFNTFGVIWVTIIFRIAFIPLVDKICPGDPYTNPAAIASHMAVFHTLFNILNTLLCLPLSKFLATLATKMVPARSDKRKERFALRFIESSIVGTPTINMNQAKEEAFYMMTIVDEMYKKIYDYLNNHEELNGRTLKALTEEISKLEDKTDRLEKEICDFLVKTSQANISIEDSEEITRMMHMVNEIERLGDNCERLMKLLNRKFNNNLNFDDELNSSIKDLMNEINEFIELILANFKTNNNIMDEADILLDRIKCKQKEVKNHNIKLLNEGHAEVNSSLLIMDILNSVQKMNDIEYNIAEGISKTRVF